MCTHYGSCLEDSLYNLEEREVENKEEVLEPINEVKRLELEGEVETGTDVVYAQFDGSFIFSDTDWQEVKLGRVFLGSDLQSVGVQSERGLIKKSEYAASLGNYTFFVSKFSVLITEAKKANRKLVFITDGAKWMKNWMTKNYKEGIQILDFFHVCEHLGEFSKELLNEEIKLEKSWYEQQKDDLKNGCLNEVIKEIKSLKLKTSSAKKKRLKLLNYFKENAYRMKYDEYINAGYMIGSGAIEAAHRTVVQKRMKLSGQRWSTQGAQPMLNLRCAFKSGREMMVRRLITKAA